MGHPGLGLLVGCGLCPVGELLRCGDSAVEQVVEEVSGAESGEWSVDPCGGGLVSELDDVGGAIVELAAAGCGAFFRGESGAGGDAPGVVAHEN